MLCQLCNENHAVDEWKKLGYPICTTCNELVRSACYANWSKASTVQEYESVLEEYRTTITPPPTEAEVDAVRDKLAKIAEELANG